jgi:hypothetical protein
MVSRRLGRWTAAAVTTTAAVALAATPAGAATTKTPYVTDYTSAYGAVHCEGKLIVSKKYPGGGKEVEKCTSTEPGGKLTGYFTPGQEYTGYWESDYYATVGKPGVQPSSVLIKVAKNFKSFRVVSAVYPVAP